MSLLLPPSALLSGHLNTLQDVERALSTVTAFRTASEVAPTLETIHEAIVPHREALSVVVARDGSTRRKDLRFFDDLLSGDDPKTRLALAELGTRPAVLPILQNDPKAARSLLDTAAGLRIETSAVRENHHRWSGPVGVGTPDVGLAGQISYWLSSLAAPKNWALWGAGASLAAEGALWLATGQMPIAALAATATAAGGAIYGNLHREAAKSRLVAYAESHPMNYEAVAAFFQSFGRPLPTQTPFAVSSDASGVVDSIRKGASGGGKPHTSHLATLGLITDFLNLGSAAVKGLEKTVASDPTGKLYDQLAHAIGVGVLSRLRTQPILFNMHVLDQVAELKRQGNNVLFVGNHRSHLDILLAVAVLRDMGIRFAAKKELQGMPTLGDILRLADHFIVDDKDPQRLPKMVAWGMRMFELGLSPFFFIEVTRKDTRDRREELGLLDPAIGAAHLSAKRPRNTYIVRMVSYGFGIILPKSESQAAKEGVMLNQPTVTSLMEPMKVSDFLDDDPNLSHEEEARFNSLIWNGMAEELFPLQAYMNDLASKAA